MTNKAETDVFKGSYENLRPVSGATTNHTFGYDLPGRPMFWLQREFTSVWVAVQKEQNLPGAPVGTLAVFRLIQNLKKELPLSFLCPGFVPDSSLKGKDPAPRCL